MAKDRLIPHDEAAEQAVLGALLIDPTARTEIADLLPCGKPFMRDAHGMIFDAICAVPTVDLVTVSSELQRRGQLDEVGGASYLTRLILETPTSVHARHYATIVERHWQLRRLLELPSQITDTIYSEATDVEQVWSRIRGLVDALQPETKSKSVLEWRESLTWYLEVQLNRVEEQDARKAGTLKDVDFPWQCLSAPGRIKRLRPGTMVVVAAESGRGKTAFAECCAEHWARAGFHVVFVHLELSHEVMLDRRARRHTGLSAQQIDAGAELGDLNDSTARLWDWPGTITYVHAPGWTAGRICATVEARAGRRPVDVVIVDYFQKIAYDRDNRFKWTSAQARGQQAEICKTMAERLGVPLLMLSQFNREGTIRDTGELEEKANVSIRIERKMNEPVADVKVEKNTFGHCFNTEMYLNGAKYLWCDLSEQEGGR